MKIIQYALCLLIASSTSLVYSSASIGFYNSPPRPNLSTVDTVPTAVNVTTADTFTAPKAVLDNLHFLLSLVKPPKDTTCQISKDSKNFVHQMVTSLQTLMGLVQQPEFTVYLQRRDATRHAAYVTPQTLTAGFTAAEADHTVIVREATQAYDNLTTSLHSLLNYDTLLHSLGEGSEVKLRDRLIPITNIVLKLFQ